MGYDQEGEVDPFMVFYKRLRKILTVLAVALFLFTLVCAIFIIYWTHSGLNFFFGVSGLSMNPTIRDGAMVAWNEKPFEEVKVGDIIVFRRRAELGGNIVLTPSTESKNGFWQTQTFTLFGEADDENPVYSYGQAIVHRVIEIVDDNGTRKLRTRGDGNDADDKYTVLSDGYAGTVVLYLNGLGSFTGWLAEGRGYLWILLATIILTTTVVLMWVKGPAQTMEAGAAPSPEPDTEEKAGE